MSKVDLENFSSSKDGNNPVLVKKIRGRIELEETENEEEMTDLMNTFTNIPFLNVKDLLKQEAGFLENEIYLLQFPSILPNNLLEKGKFVLDVDGKIGDIQVLQNGRMICHIGDVKFDLSEGTESFFLQSLVSLDISHQRAVELGEISKKFIIQPEIF